MSYSFDQIIDRKNTNSLKYDFAKERNRPEHILPLWVADMDFQIAEPILTDIRAAVEHGIFGYSEAKTPYFTAVHDWFLKHYHWDTKEEWLIKTPGIVFALAMAVKAYTNPGDAVLIQAPVYYPFHEVIQDNDRVLINNELQYENGTYHIDFADFEEKIVSNNVKLFLLCSPHNPVGRVWRKEELERIAQICLSHNVIIVSDEIHCDFTFPGHTHTTFATLSKEVENQCVICTSPTKTFNFAGLQISNIFIPNEELRKKFKHQIDAAGYSQVNTFGLIASQSAYTKGEEWLVELKKYLLSNLDYLRTFLQERIPKIKLIEPEGTYLIWLDCHELGLSNTELRDFITYKANLWLDGGYLFSKNKDAAQFERINIACPRATLKQALEQLETAVNSL